jgi:hypothetical protein
MTTGIDSNSFGLARFSDIRRFFGSNTEETQASHRSHDHVTLRSSKPVHHKRHATNPSSRTAQPDSEPMSNGPVNRAAHARGTGYYPANNKMEGGFKDRQGHKLYTLQDYLAGKAPYVSVAMDSHAAKYGQQVRIPEMEQKYGRPIDFRVVDTGGAFRGKGTSRIDICTANNRASHDSTINGPLTIDFVG